MAAQWVTANSARFIAEILQVFCQTSKALEEQCDRYRQAGHISSAILHDLLGGSMNKGPLWRLKDLAHHLLRDTGDASPAGRLLDWSIGYIFHETVKLKEAAHQYRYYMPRIEAFMAEYFSAADSRPAAETFHELVTDNSNDMARGIERIQSLLHQARSFFLLYYAGMADNRTLARFLYDNEALVRQVFSAEYDAFIHSIYDGDPQRLLMEAAWSLFDGAHYQAAYAAVQKVLHTAHEHHAAKILAARCLHAMETL